MFHAAELFGQNERLFLTERTSQLSSEAARCGEARHNRLGSSKRGRYRVFPHELLCGRWAAPTPRDEKPRRLPWPTTASAPDHRLGLGPSRCWRESATGFSEESGRYPNFHQRGELRA